MDGMTGIRLCVQDLSKRYQSHGAEVVALEGIGMEIRDKEFATILGPSGCGKSTLLRILAGLSSPSGGEASLDGRRIQGPGRERGMVFQNYTLFPWLTVLQNIQFGLSLAGKAPAESERVARAFIGKIGLTGFENAYPKSLSGGMKQRVAIARALVNDPNILLLDEPFGALDTQTRSLMQELLLQIWEDLHKTILFVTHDVEEAVFLSDRIFIMTARPGRIKAVLEVPLPRPRDYEIKSAPDFTSIKKEVSRLIREESIKALHFAGSEKGGEK
jgi:ABC-type nitrate/sulfonate/bicarbonate transport system ATPase subunit